MSLLPGIANVVDATMVEVDGSVITSGTVNFYLIALNGANAGKWFKGADQTWSATEAVAAAGTHKAEGSWTASVHADAWIDGVDYRLYASESTGISIAYGYRVQCRSGVTLTTAGIGDIRRMMVGLFARSPFTQALAVVGRDAKVQVNLISTTDGLPVASVAYTDVTVNVWKTGDAAKTAVTVLEADWAETVDGYTLNIGAAEWTSSGPWFITVEASGCETAKVWVSVSTTDPRDTFMWNTIAAIKGREGVTGTLFFFGPDGDDANDGLTWLTPRADPGLMTPDPTSATNPKPLAATCLFAQIAVGTAGEFRTPDGIYLLPGVTITSRPVRSPWGLRILGSGPGVSVLSIATTYCDVTDYQWDPRVLSPAADNWKRIPMVLTSEGVLVKGVRLNAGPVNHVVAIGQAGVGGTRHMTIEDCIVNAKQCAAAWGETGDYDHQPELAVRRTLFYGQTPVCISRGNANYTFDGCVLRHELATVTAGLFPEVTQVGAWPACAMLVTNCYGALPRNPNFGPHLRNSVLQAVADGSYATSGLRLDGMAEESYSTSNKMTVTNCAFDVTSSVSAVDILNLAAYGAASYTVVVSGCGKVRTTGSTGTVEVLDTVAATIAADVAGLDGAAMRGTDGAALASAWTATRAGYLENLSAGAVATAEQVAALNNLSASQVQAAATAAILAYGVAKASDLSGLALEATLTAMKGAGWASTETIKALYALAAAIKAKSDLIGAGTVTVTSPVAVNGDMTLYRNSSYTAGPPDRRLTLTATVEEGLNITGATASMSIVPRDDYDSVTRADGADLAWATLGTAALSLAGTTLTASVSITAAQMAALNSSPPNGKFTYAYHLRAKTQGGLMITDWAGDIEVLDAPD